MIRTLAIVVLSALLAACVAPYRTVYVNEAGDYYIAETGSASPRVVYLDPGGQWAYTGLYPWWTFHYYSPYFYPYHFSVWYPPHYPWYGRAYRPHRPGWRPPYRPHHPHDGFVHQPGGAATGSARLPVGGVPLRRLEADPAVLARIYQLQRGRDVVRLRAPDSGTAVYRTAPASVDGPGRSTPSRRAAPPTASPPDHGPGPGRAAARGPLAGSGRRAVPPTSRNPYDP